MRPYNHHFLRWNQFKNWHSFVCSIGVHLIVLSFLPVWLMDLAKTPKRPTLIRLVEVPPREQPRVQPKVEPQMALVKNEIKPPEPKVVQRVVPVPQTASAIFEALTATNIQKPTAPAKAFSVSGNDRSPMVDSSAHLVASFSVSWETAVNQFHPRSQSEFSNNLPAAEMRSRSDIATSRALEPFAAKPLSPVAEVANAEDLKGIEDGFALLIRERIASAKTYPPAARQAGQEGKVLVAFVLGKDGRILDLAVDRSSSHERLDQAAVQAVKNAGPYPPIPEKLGRDSISFKLPISFNLR